MQFPFLLVVTESRRWRTCAESLRAARECPAGPLAEDVGSGTKSFVMCIFRHPRIPPNETRVLVETSGPPFAACYEEHELRPNLEHRIRTPVGKRGVWEDLKTAVEIPLSRLFDTHKNILLSSSEGGDKRVAGGASGRPGQPHGTHKE